jgi:ubiquinone/menaquinone biosynthesis C-methylase UbiE
MSRFDGVQMEASEDFGRRGTRDVKRIDWDAYASQYDLLATNNPSYRENIEILRSLLPSFGLPDQPSVCDLGGGTGNYTCALSADIRGASFVHVDADEEMNRIARCKFADAGIESVEVITASALDIDFPDHSFDLLIMINSLYAMSPQRDVLARVHRWLKPSGTFFVIDFGRRTKVLDWARFILGNMLREKGLFECLRFLRSSLENLRQNRRGARAQLDGVYWLHSTEEFGALLSESGFYVEMIRACYRGYCDLAVCRPVPMGNSGK